MKLNKLGIMFGLTCLSCLPASLVLAQSPVTLAIDTRSPGGAIPSDFSGLSFETDSLQNNSPGVTGYLFDPANTQLLTLFKNLGIKNLRIGGDSVDRSSYFPANQDIDALFRFAKAAEVNVIYSLPLLNGEPSQDAAAAKYVWDNYQPYLTCFAMGNEPNLYNNQDPEIGDAASFVGKWTRFALAVSNAVPDAKFGGPDNDMGGTGWAAAFLAAEKPPGIVTWYFAHDYIGGGTGRKTAPQLIDQMLSQNWDTVRYPAYYDKTGAKASALGLPYRLTELNSFFTSYPGVWGGNNSFATALFALDCMHWWAAHNCRGVNFHTVVGKYNGTIYCDAKGGYQIYPMGYGIKAFDLGGHGKTVPVAITNPDSLNLTAYAVIGTSDLFITIINKEHGAGAKSASVAILPNGLVPEKAGVMFLTPPAGDIAATNDITLGGASITDNTPWQGQWTTLEAATTNQGMLTVPAASAAIVKLPLQ